jgi:DNA uptake protein ComE-like DNA-binding protein
MVALLGLVGTMLRHNRPNGHRAMKGSQLRHCMDSLEGAFMRERAKEAQSRRKPPSRRNPMRLKQLALATFFGAVMALPAMAQTTPVVPSKPVITAPATPAAPVVAAPAVTTPKTAAKPVKPVAGPVNVNTATPAELDALPGIGKARTASIIKNRPYKSVDEVDTKKAIPHAVFEKIKAQLTI